MKKVTFSLIAVLMMAIMVLPSISVRADGGGQTGKAEFKTKIFANLSVSNGNLDCDFGTVDPNANPNPTCNPTGSLVVDSNSSWHLTTVKSAASTELVNVLRVANNTDGTTLVDFGTSTGSITGSNDKTMPVKYELRAGSGPAGGGYLANLPGNTSYEVTVTYTVSTP